MLILHPYAPAEASGARRAPGVARCRHRSTPQHWTGTILVSVITTIVTLLLAEIALKPRLLAPVPDSNASSVPPLMGLVENGSGRSSVKDLELIVPRRDAVPSELGQERQL